MANLRQLRGTNVFRSALHRRRLQALALGALTLGAVAAAMEAQARDPLYGALTDADLAQCEELYWGGRTAGAQQCYRNLSVANKPAGIRAEAL